MDTKFIAEMEHLTLVTTAQERAVIIQEMAKMFTGKNTPAELSIVQSSNFIKVLAEVMKENEGWASSDLTWIADLMCCIYYDMRWAIPLDQTTQIFEVTSNYLFTHVSVATVRILLDLCRPLNSTPLLATNTALYNKMKEIIINDTTEAQDWAVYFLKSYSWLDISLIILNDTEFLNHLISAPTTTTWAVFAELAAHPDAKILLPRKVIEKASLVTSSERCQEICALLCNEDDLTSMKLDAEYVKIKTERLQRLLDNQHKVESVHKQGLLSLLAPLVNLSLVESNKVLLGKDLIPPLKRVLEVQQDDRPLIPHVAIKLMRCKQEAAKILWNLAFLESNRALIAANSGLEFLKSILTGITDKVLEANIKGILYMFSRTISASSTLGGIKGGHVMISYNWDNQKTVLHLAESLKEHGYNIWMDVERMEGSTLEAMAGAIEGAEIVLMCMSQKYKDSPNCRLEGEYCINRKVAYVPLMMQKDYQPDGWLGIVLGSKLWYPFASEDDWDTKIANLVKVIGNFGKASSPLSRSQSLSTTKLPTKRAEIEAWTNEDILNWMQKSGIARHYEVFVQHEIDGKSLLELKEFVNSSGSLLFHFLCQQMNITSVGQLTKITAAIRRLY